MTQTIGFIGLGIMGKPMARHLIGAGHGLVVHDVYPESVNELIADGAASADSPRAVAEASDVVITMLPDSPHVSQVVAGEGGLLEGASAGMLIVDMSTISPIVSRELAVRADEHGVGMLDAPVSGGEVGAIEARLSIMVGASQDDFDRVRPLLHVMGTPLLVGPPGAGQVVKACNQVVVALNIAAVSEALVLGSKAGVDPSLIIDALKGGLAGSRVMETKSRNFLEHEFTPGFRIDLHRKDLGIALATAREYGASVPFTAMIDQVVAALQAKGHGSDDHSSILAALEEASQHTIGSPATQPA